MNGLITSHKERSNKILTLKKEFDNIKIFNNDVVAIFDNLDTKINKLKDIYKTFLNENQNTLFIFGLDAFKFQNRLIDEEYISLKKYFDLICNRVYCDYYKLYNIIVDYILKDSTLEKIHNSAIKDKYEKYNYLDVYKHYSITASADIFNDIVNLITLLSDESKSITNLIKSYNSKKRYGLNLNNFIYTHAYKNSILNEEMNLYINYLAFFLRLHMKYFRRFINKIQLMYSEINSDINFDNEGNKRNSGGKYISRPLSSLSTSIHSPTTEDYVYNNISSSDSGSDETIALTSPLSVNNMGIGMEQFISLVDNSNEQEQENFIISREDSNENRENDKYSESIDTQNNKVITISNNSVDIRSDNEDEDEDEDEEDEKEQRNEIIEPTIEQRNKKSKKRGKRGKKNKH